MIGPEDDLLNQLASLRRAAYAAAGFPFELVQQFDPDTSAAMLADLMNHASLIPIASCPPAYNKTVCLIPVHGINPGESAIIDPMDTEAKIKRKIEEN